MDSQQTIHSDWLKSKCIPFEWDTLMGRWRSVGRDANSSTASRRWRIASKSVMGSSKLDRSRRLPAAVWHPFRADKRDGPPVGFKLLTTSSRLAVSESNSYKEITAKQGYCLLFFSEAKKKTCKQSKMDTHSVCRLYKSTKVERKLAATKRRWRSCFNSRMLSICLFSFWVSEMGLLRRVESILDSKLMLARNLFIIL